MCILVHVDGSSGNSMHQYMYMYKYMYMSQQQANMC